jgi:hypothetical protein
MLRKLAGTLAAVSIVALAACTTEHAPPPAAPPAAAAAPAADATRRFANATVVGSDGKVLKVTSAEGQAVSIALNADTKILRNRVGTPADLKPGVFVGCTAVEGADRKLRATEIRVFPEALRGIGEGHYPWPVDNPQPNTTMTNGNVEVVQGVTDGHVIKVSYKGGVTDIEIPADVPIMVTEIAGADTLKAGAKVNITANVGADGSLTARFIRVL